MSSRKKRPLRRGARFAGAPKIPLAVERYMHAGLARMAKGFAAYVRRAILPRVKDFARPEADERADAKDAPRNPAAKAEGRKIAAAADQAFDSAQLKALSRQAVGKMVAHSKDQFRKLGIDVKKEPDLKVLVSGWTRDVAERAKGMSREQARKLEDILATGQSRHAATLEKEMVEQLGVTESRAAFLARDAVGTLNSKITRHRFEAAGIKSYIWTTSDDERVRDAHVELDGEEFDVDGPGDPEEGHPGEPPNCRCIQFPLDPRGDDGGDDEGSSGSDDASAEDEG